MTRTLIVLAAFLTLAVPAALAAPPVGKGKPDNPGKSAAAPGQSAEKNAAKKCKALRTSNRASFEATYGDKPNALGKCVAAMEKKAEDAKDAEEAAEAKDNAAKKCKKERDEIGSAPFKAKYAPVGHPNGANAFGKCVSKLAKQLLSS